MRTHGPKLNRDWIGLRVMLKREARNRLGIIRKGTHGTITDYSCGRQAIHFDADSCAQRKCALSITGMHRSDFMILTPPEEWKDTREFKVSPALAAAEAARDG